MQSDKFTLRECSSFDELGFAFTKDQLQMLNEWIIGVEQRAANLQAEDKSEGKHIDYSIVPLPYYGPTGGGLKFTFIPNGIGVTCVVTEAITGESIDLTVYDEW